MHSFRKLSLLILFTLISLGLEAAPRNMLPRFPELIIEKGLSENFKVTECRAHVKISGTDADTGVKVQLLNQGSSAVKSSLKVRILYPTSENQVKIKIDGKSQKYDRANPRHEFELQPQQSISIELSARTQINYSVDSVRKALREQEEEEKQTKRKTFLMSDFTSLFEREKFGHRFMVGPIVSKWGVFPIDFTGVDIEVNVPSEFVMVTENSEIWKESRNGGSKVFRTSDPELFKNAVFLPESDKEDFIKTQKILSSEKFLH